MIIDRPFRRNKMTWEPIYSVILGEHTGRHIQTERLAVPGGWIYKVVEIDPPLAFMGTCFVPNHNNDR